MYLVHAGEGDLQGHVLVAALGRVQLPGLRQRHSLAPPRHHIQVIRRVVVQRHDHSAMAEPQLGVAEATPPRLQRRERLQRLLERLGDGRT